MCRDPILRRKPCVPTTFINIITTTATPTLRMRTSRTSEGDDRAEATSGRGVASAPADFSIPHKDYEAIRRCRVPVDGTDAERRATRQNVRLHVGLCATA